MIVWDRSMWKELRIGLVALAVSQKATVTVFSDFRGGKSRANAFWRNSMIFNRASHVFFSASRGYRICAKSKIQWRINQELIKMTRASLTIASTRKNRPEHGSCLRNPRARLVFPVTTGVKLAKSTNTMIGRGFDCDRPAKQIEE